MFHVEHSDRVARWISEGSANLGVSLDHDQISQLDRYLKELKRWNKTVNLTSVSEDKEIIVKHFLDSLYGGQFLEFQQTSAVLDVGAGAGFPGLPLKILHREIALTLLEPNKKKVAFLHHVIGSLHLKNVQAISQSVEAFSRGRVDESRFTHIVTRALSISRALPFLCGLLSEGGQVILWRTQALGGKTGLSGFKVPQEISYVLPYGYGNRKLVVLTRC